MKIFQTKSRFSKKAKTMLLAAFAIMGVLCVVFVYMGVQYYTSKKDLDAQSASISSKLAEDQSEISELNDVTDKTGQAYRDYVESKAREEGYGKPGETIHENELYGN